MAFVTTPPLVTLQLHRVPARRVPAAVARMALDRRHLHRTPGLEFAKLLGTGDGRTFDARDADLRTWGLLAVWSAPEAAGAFTASPVARAWDRIAEESWRVDLRPLAAHGRWSGRMPFGGTTAAGAAEVVGAVAAITRARLRPARMRAFWRAVPPVNAALQAAPGLLLSIGIGEAPVGLQGTFSLWDSAASLRAFAYGTDAHRDVITRTISEGWYAEELFARFAVLGTAGTLDGRDPLAPGH
jgi:hypothetical protein